MAPNRPKWEIFIYEKFIHYKAFTQGEKPKNLFRKSTFR